MADELELIINKRSFRGINTTTKQEYFSTFVDKFRWKRDKDDNFTFYNSTETVNQFGEENLNILGIRQNDVGEQVGVGSFDHTRTINPDTSIKFVSADIMATWLGDNTGFFFNPNPIEVTGGIEGLLTQDALVAIGEGKVPGKSIVVIEARNIDVDTSIVDIGMEDTNFTWPTSAIQMEILSDDTTDSSTGIGARSVTISGLDGNFDPISETIATNGITPVLTVNDYIRINEFSVTDSGSYASTTQGSNNGNITLRASGGGATHSFISNDLVGNGHHQDGKFTFPNNHIGVVLGVGLNVNSSKSAKLFFQVRTGADIVTPPFSSRRVIGVVDGKSGRHEIPREELNTTLPGKTDVWASAIAEAVNTEVSVRITVLLIDLS